MERENREALLRQLREAFGNRKYFLISAAHPDCLWVEQFARARRDLQMDPCADFYAYACGTNWTSVTLPLDGTAYRRLTVEQTLLNLHSYFNSTIHRNFPEELEGRFLHQVWNL
ncbi:unnamed protein product, partial [Ixodes hexagonus]